MSSYKPWQVISRYRLWHIRGRNALRRQPRAHRQTFTLVGEDEEDLQTVRLDELAAFMSKSALPESVVTAIDKDLAGKLELAWPKIVSKSGH
jgi:hypothetical protein